MPAARVEFWAGYQTSRFSIATQPPVLQANLCDAPQGPYRRSKFIQKLIEGDNAHDKVRVFQLSRPDLNCGTYVHAKVWIFDDKFAIIGSANCNRRGMKHDSEAAAGIFDPSDDDLLTYTFAQRLRIKLWAHHLGIDHPVVRIPVQVVQ